MKSVDPNRIRRPLSRAVHLGLAAAIASATPVVLMADTAKVAAARAEAEATTAIANPGTPIYIALDQEVTSRKKDFGLGDVVEARVWQDVLVGTNVVIERDTPVFASIARIKKSNFAGIKGKLEIEAISTTDVAGNAVELVGGYDRSGKGRMGLSISLAAVVAWPLIFIKGKQAVLPPGTLFDAHLRSVVEVDTALAPQVTVPPRDVTAEILYDDIDFETKPVLIPFSVHSSRPFVVVEIIAVNGSSLEEAIPLQYTEHDEAAGTALGTVEWKPLTKQMRPGMNELTLRVGGDLVDVLMEAEL